MFSNRNSAKLKISLCAFLIFSAFAIAQKTQKIGYIDMAYILENVPEYLEAQNTLDSKITKWRSELDLSLIHI